MKKINPLGLTSVLQWGLVLVIFYAIWKCFQYRIEDIQEDFVTIDIANLKKDIEVEKGKLSPNESCAGTCTGTGTAGGMKLLPILDPCFNMREICKQSILLEDHLFQTEKRCSDCIKKHFLTLEGLSEEAITLDKENEYKFSKMQLPEKIRKLEKEFIAGKNPEDIAQQLRQIRKPLMEKYFDKF